MRISDWSSDVCSSDLNFRGDERYLRQILINLLSNAIKFTPAGGRITVRASRGREGGIAITVADTGIGIPDRHLTRVFEPFYQVQSALARPYQGTGLGLSLVRGLVELHGGRVARKSDVEGKSGAGRG